MHFSFYLIDADYCNYLREADPCVPYNMEHKAARPFIGIVFTVNGFHYYAPLSSPKKKHLHMKNQPDFMKINRGEWGVINFNNMIPVPFECLTKINPQIHASDSKQDISYKNLLSNQLSWCNSHKDAILKQADKLYHIITQGKAWGSLSERCCNFSIDEQRCLLYRLSPISDNP